ncbi:hypothetical protein [Weissella paramesenteroides]|uniref:Uncharacterized protein n=1 Tax=Weissella paramesenteroides ATCC 33313 TaxID=585506 RepID=C5RCF1_WEIPA|nr:hypothetical protein [Weissella paramesenteroides]ATF41407.1 hypothetical protein CO680_04775 [Weissella paramesenteroides]EER74107.1 hypothetical protein HMPREF0877_1647 [Weissella paramesenteroides ATCC 33313]
MKKKLGIIQVLAILIIGIMIGAFAERSHVFGYADNTPIIPNGTYKTTSTNAWKKITLNNNNFKSEANESVIVDNRYTNRKNGRLVITGKRSGTRAWAYYVTKIKEGWQVSPIINGKPDHNSDFIIYAN